MGSSPFSAQYNRQNVKRHTEGVIDGAQRQSRETGYQI